MTFVNPNKVHVLSKPWSKLNHSHLSIILILKKMLRIHHAKLTESRVAFNSALHPWVMFKWT